jgi:hypothetical protein
MYICQVGNEIGNKHDLLHYGKRYPAADICADARLLHKDRVHHAPIHTSEFSENIIVLTQKYKQSPAMINAVLDSLNKYNAQQMYDHPQQVPNAGFGEYGGRISIMGSGGSNTVLGHFAPTTKCHKNDPLIVIGVGQNHLSRINKTLDELATNQSVRAIFLNEKCYGSESTEHKQRSNSLRFLGYYQFNESRFVNGDKREDVAKEFNNPSPLEWENLTFRLHPHLRLEASPFIPSFREVHELITKGSTSFQKIVISHDDNSDIIYSVPEQKDWKKINYQVTIKDVIADMISSGEFNDTDDKEKENNDGYQDYTDDTYLELTDCNSLNNTSITNRVRHHNVDEDDDQEASDVNTVYVDPEENCLNNTSSSNNRELDDTVDEEEDSNGNQEDTDSDYNDYNSSTDTLCSHGMSECVSDNDDMKIKAPTKKQAVASQCIKGTSNITFKKCLEEIVSYVYNEVPEIHLSILGYTKQRCTIQNVVNGRPFTVVDAEHFLCKAWLVASSAFGSARLSNYPKLCNAHMHPSPIIHALADTVIDAAMDSIQAAYCLCNEKNSKKLILPEFIRLPSDGFEL